MQLPFKPIRLFYNIFQAIICKKQFVVLHFYWKLPILGPQKHNTVVMNSKLFLKKKDFVFIKENLSLSSVKYNCGKYLEIFVLNKKTGLLSSFFETYSNL